MIHQRKIIHSLLDLLSEHEYQYECEYYERYDFEECSN